MQVRVSIILSSDYDDDYTWHFIILPYTLKHTHTNTYFNIYRYVCL